MIFFHITDCAWAQNALALFLSAMNRIARIRWLQMQLASFFAHKKMLKCSTFAVLWDTILTAKHEYFMQFSSNYLIWYLYQLNECCCFIIHVHVGSGASCILKISCTGTDLNPLTARPLFKKLFFNQCKFQLWNAITADWLKV